MLLIQQALLSIAEPMLNHVLQYDNDAPAKLNKLNNQSLSVELTDLSVNLTVKVFDNRVFVSGQSEPADCIIKTTIDGLQKLSDAAQITALIRSGQLDLEGDLQVAQGFSTLLMDNNIDWQEWLSEYLGDAMTFKLSQAIQKQKTYWARKKRDLDYTAQSALIDELRVTPDHIELNRFSADVDRLNAQTERLFSEIQKLKAQLWNQTAFHDFSKSLIPFCITACTILFRKVTELGTYRLHTLLRFGIRKYQNKTAKRLICDWHLSR